MLKLGQNILLTVGLWLMTHVITKKHFLFASCTTETLSGTLPIFIRVQLLSICWLAWRKYRPSVHIAACCSVTMAVPARNNKRKDLNEKRIWYCDGDTVSLAITACLLLVCYCCILRRGQKLFNSEKCHATSSSLIYKQIIPAEPLNPQIYSRLQSHGAMYSLWKTWGQKERSASLTISEKWPSTSQTF